MEAPPIPQRRNVKESLAPLLLQQITRFIQDSGANQTEARCALEAAIAMIPEMGIDTKPTHSWG